MVAGIALGAATVSMADDFSVRLGYAWSGDFRDTSGNTAKLEGPEIALGLNLGNFSKLQYGIEASYFGGGRLRHGADFDGDIYRFILVGKYPFANGQYLKAGVGFGHSVDRASEFNAESGVVGQFGAGFPISGFLPQFKPNFEVNYYAAANGQLRSLTLGISFGF